MVDKHTKQQRSYNMSKIKNSNTKPEQLVCKSLFHLGYRYRKNDKRFPGKPDIYLPKYKTVIFVNGCFWHGHEGCTKSKLPKTNYEFWKEKIDNNTARDKRNIKKLESMGFQVITVWECDIKKSLESIIDNIDSRLKNI
jgi:DNA mismatch endonuclease (patch repair protein)